MVSECRAEKNGSHPALEESVLERCQNHDIRTQFDGQSVNLPFRWIFGECLKPRAARL